MPVVKFHISDVLSVLCSSSKKELEEAFRTLIPPPPNPKITSLPEYPPQDENGTWPARRIPIQGTITLAEFITGKTVPLTNDPDTGRLIMTSTEGAFIIAEAHDILQKQLSFMLPLDKTLLPSIDLNDNLAIRKATVEALPALITKYGEYIDIMGVGRQRSTDRGGGDGSPTGFQRY